MMHVTKLKVYAFVVLYAVSGLVVGSGHTPFCWTSHGARDDFRLNSSCIDIIGNLRRESLQDATKIDKAKKELDVALSQAKEAKRTDLLPPLEEVRGALDDPEPAKAVNALQQKLRTFESDLRSRQQLFVGSGPKPADIDGAFLNTADKDFAARVKNYCGNLVCLDALAFKATRRASYGRGLITLRSSVAPDVMDKALARLDTEVSSITVLDLLPKNGRDAERVFGKEHVPEPDLQAKYMAFFESRVSNDTVKWTADLKKRVNVDYKFERYSSVAAPHVEPAAGAPTIASKIIDRVNASRPGDLIVVIGEIQNGKLICPDGKESIVVADLKGEGTCFVVGCRSYVLLKDKGGALGTGQRIRAMEAYDSVLLMLKSAVADADAGRPLIREFALDLQNRKAVDRAPAANPAVAQPEDIAPVEPGQHQNAYPDGETIYVASTSTFLVVEMEIA